MTLDTVFCTQCGSRNPAAARFCDQCGAMLVKPVAPAGGPATIAPTPIAPMSAAAAAPQQAGTIICSQCGIAALPGEAFCDNCGAALSAPAALAPQPTYPPPQPAAPQTTTVSTPASPAAAPPAATAQAPVASTPASPAAAPPAAARRASQPAARMTLAPAQLQVEGSRAILALPVAATAVVGRADPASNFYPDIDLTPHGALENGVGRRHLRLAVRDGQFTVEDLDSTNGTAVNGQRLTPRQTYPLAPGDLLLVGRLSLRLVEP